jgi:hypothetical protein
MMESIQQYRWRNPTHHEVPKPHFRVALVSDSIADANTT